MQRVYPKPELLELSEYLIPNGAPLNLPSRFEKSFQFLFQFLHPTHLRSSSKSVLHQRPTRAELLRERAAALYSGVRTCSAALILLSSFLIGGHSGSRSRSTASDSAMVVRCSVGSFTSPPIGQLGQSISADRRNSGPSLSILSGVLLGSSRVAMDGHYYPAGSYILWKVQKNQSVRCVCPRRGIEIEPDF